MTHHVILGAGPAGVIAAETIRQHAPSDRITLVGNEAEPPYSRMAIPYLLMGNIDERGTYLRKGATHFADLRINQLQAQAERVDTATKTIAFNNGEALAYDRLLIATGSHPASPPIPGLDSAGVHPCWTLADARNIMALAQPGARVLQMGAGFIGCIIMEALTQRGVRLTVVEMGDRMVPRMMGPVAGGMIKDWCQAQGVQVFTGTRVEAIVPGTPPHTPLQVRLSNGQTLEAELVISATGVKPNIGFLEHSGITCLQGVLTDEHLQTNVAGVYAAGDCAEAFDKVSGTTMVSAIQPNAAEQARVAALNMVGQRTALRGVTQINVLDTLGLISTSFGNWQGVAGSGPADRVELTEHQANGGKGRHLSLQFKDDVMVGCNSVGWTEHVGVMRGLVEGAIHLGPWKERLKQDPTQLMQAYLASAQGQGAWNGASDERRR
ncbi:Pyridine nucleotide-disulphide oxidoreductase [Polaromonas sp. OV174]|uniref:NAD(P)/FAD-dependent oxidoreductase n=1 Tax=Polaromonas sp. OV174 TaxID=1855300 RepID=UPI0008E68E55|nr:FAD-dependent oxidoreductase [Polaromonas sp. OV174]SFB83946.1 Pyridine nucleotide-disulphide oxidoreductase [Polaromonas sp. OV174]